MSAEIKKGILLSYPRSGNHLVRFLIEFLTMKPTKGCMRNPEDKYIKDSNFDPEENPLVHVKGDWVWCKHHFVEEIDQNKRLDKDFADNITGMILLFRNPVECVMRHTFYGKESYHWNHAIVDPHLKKVESSIDAFLEFGDSKHLVIYERLLDEDTREDEIKKLSEFVGGIPHRLEELLDDIEYYWHVSLASKMNQKEAICISGEDPKFHSKRTKNLDELKDHVDNRLGEKLKALYNIRS